MNAFGYSGCLQGSLFGAARLSFDLYFLFFLPKICLIYILYFLVSLWRARLFYR